MDFVVPQIWYGKVAAELTPTSMSKTEEEEEEVVVEKRVLAACPSWAV